MSSEPNFSVIKQQLDNCLKLLKNILGPDFLGVYLYGSYLLGGLQKYSDIDLLDFFRNSTSAGNLYVGSVLESSRTSMYAPA